MFVVLGGISTDLLCLWRWEVPGVWTEICCVCGVGKCRDKDLLCLWCWKVSRQRFVVFAVLGGASTEIWSLWFWEVSRQRLDVALAGLAVHTRQRFCLVCGGGQMTEMIVLWQQCG